MDKFEEILNTIETETKEAHQNSLSKFMKNWYWFATFCFLGIITGLLFFTFTPPIYLVQSRLLIHPRIMHKIHFFPLIIGLFQKIKK